MSRVMIVLFLSEMILQNVMQGLYNFVSGQNKPVSELPLVIITVVDNGSFQRNMSSKTTLSKLILHSPLFILICLITLSKKEVKINKESSQSNYGIYF